MTGISVRDINGIVQPSCSRSIWLQVLMEKPAAVTPGNPVRKCSDLRENRRADVWESAVKNQLSCP